MSTDGIPPSLDDRSGRRERKSSRGNRVRASGTKTNGLTRSTGETAGDHHIPVTSETEAAKQVTKPIEVEEDDGAEPCFICAESIQYSAITACNHRTCHVCALRLRALYKNEFCAHCRTESKSVLFTLPSEKVFTDYDLDTVAAKDEKLGILFETPTIMEETMILLRFNCPVDTCDVSAAGWPDLKVHIRQAHNQVICDLCRKNKKIFTHEHDLFSQQGLTHHYKFGDRDAQDDNGFKGHPECGFCRQAFYDDDELYKHCRDKHERCHVCDQLDNGPGRAQYFQDYKQLDQHFRREHFVCPNPGCLEQKFVVFGSEIDLKAHQLEAHPNGMSGQALRSARKINTTFAGYEGPANARGNRRGRPDIQFQSTNTSNTHLSREQQALQRQFEYQQSRAQMSGFGTALSDPDPPPQPAMQVPVPAPAVQRAPPVEAFPALGGGTGSTIIKTKLKKNDKSPATKASNAGRPTDAVAINGGPGPDVSRHQAVLDRVSMAASYDAEKVALFKTNMAQYRSTNINATELIDNLHTLLKVTLDALGSIITSSADLLDSETKRVELMAAWNDWKIRHTPDSSVTSGGGQRILNIKNRASRTASQTSSVWNTAAGAARGKDPMTTAAQKLAQMQVSNGRNRSHYTPAWSASAANSRPASGTSTPLQHGQPSAALEFPSLPLGSRRRVDTTKYFSGGGWGTTETSVIGPEDYEETGEETAVPASAPKGKKKPKKQLLFSQGLQRG